MYIFSHYLFIIIIISILLSQHGFPMFKPYIDNTLYMIFMNLITKVKS